MPSSLPRRLLVLVVAIASASIADGQAIASFRVASGLSRPVWVGSPPGDFDRLFVVEQWEARIRIIKNGTLLATPFLDLPTTTVVNSGNERGLLGLAFHPDYENNGYFYLNYNNPSGHTVVARYSRSASNPDLADPASAIVLQMTSGVTTYSFAQPFSNHNGGWMAFGPDGYLYISAGDGGSGGDPQANGQNVNVLLGKMLRVDVNNPNPPYYSIPPSNPFAGAIAGRDEIWAYGLRNPWRCGFDRATGDLWIGDVGQNAREEIDYQPAFDPANPTATAGRNYGWNCREGVASYSGCTPTNYVAPIYDYAQGTGTSAGFCVVGGYVYRGCAIPGLEGTYFFGDYSNSRLWSLRRNGSSVIGFTDRTASLTTALNGGTLTSPSSFGDDALGELYICDHGGEVFKIVPATANNAAATVTLGGTPTVGTTVNLNLSSPADPNAPFVFAMALDFHPGILLPDFRTIPLALDPIFLFTVDPLCPVLSGHYGTLGANGTATVQFIIPGGAGLAGLRLFGAFVIANGTSPSGIAKISCPISITLQ